LTADAALFYDQGIGHLSGEAGSVQPIDLRRAGVK
jgi:hypothetical protein